LAEEKLILVEGLADQIHGRFDRAALFNELALDSLFTLASERSERLCCKNWKWRAYQKRTRAGRSAGAAINRDSSRERE
jgi:hypothetical protein